MGTPTIGGDTSGSVTEGTGDIVTGDLDDVGLFTGNNDDTWSISAGATYGTATIDPDTGTWSYDLDDSNPAVAELDFGDELTDTFTVLMVDDDGGSDTQVITITISGVTCFTEGTMILTDAGAVPVEDIETGTQVMTRDQGLQPVVWVGRRHFGAEELYYNPKLRPVQIAKGALGPNVPAEDLCVSPQHRVLIHSKLAGRIFDEEQVLIPAIKLVGLPGITHLVDAPEVRYHHLLLEDHQILFSNGAPSESMYLGEAALAMLTEEAREEVLAIFPGIDQPGALPVPARPIADDGKTVREFARRTLKNNQPLLQLAS